MIHTILLGGAALVSATYFALMVFDATCARILSIAQAILALHTRPKPPTAYDRRFKLGAMSDEWDRQLREDSWGRR